MLSDIRSFFKRKDTLLEEACEQRNLKNYKYYLKKHTKEELSQNENWALRRAFYVGDKEILNEILNIYTPEELVYYREIFYIIRGELEKIKIFTERIHMIKSSWFKAFFNDAVKTNRYYIAEYVIPYIDDDYLVDKYPDVNLNFRVIIAKHAKIGEYQIVELACDLAGDGLFEQLKELDKKQTYQYFVTIMINLCLGNYSEAFIALFDDYIEIASKEDVDIGGRIDFFAHSTISPSIINFLNRPLIK